MNKQLLASLVAPVLAGAMAFPGFNAETAEPRHDSPASSQRQPTPPPPWDPEQKVPEAEANEAYESEAANGQIDVTGFLDTIVQDADQVWTDFFNRSDYLVEPFVTAHYVGTSSEPTYTMRCGGGVLVDADHPNAYYCETGQGDIILPVNTFAKIWQGEFFRKAPKKTGDFAAAVVVAHEFGHHVQDEIFKQYNAKGVPLPDLHPDDENEELIADCFSGIWAFTAYNRGWLDETDYPEAIASLREIADPPGASSHGDPDERQAAFELGITTGEPNRCIVSYWPAAAVTLHLL
jgi:predicted metalloprotease